MIKKNKRIILAIVINLFITVAVISFAEDWVGPTGDAPNHNLKPPINVSEFYQLKIGGLGIGTALVVGQDILIDGTINKVGIGTTNPEATLHIVGDLIIEGGQVKTKSGEVKCEDGKYMIGFDTNGIICDELRYAN